MNVGACTANLSGCNCFNGYDGYLCQSISTTTETSLQSSSTNWIIVVAVVSAIAGLLLILSIAMCLFFVLRRRKQSSKETSPTIKRPQFTIPRAHVPTMGTGSQAVNAWDGFSLDNTYDEQFVDASDSFPSSSTTTYNTTYRTNDARPKADFGIFDELENRIPISRGHIPQTQMANILGTLNSLPARELVDEPSRAATPFSDARHIDEIELVTDMLEDMTRNDDIEDEFVEALNPNLVIPRAALQPERESSGWFSVCLK